MKGEERRGPWGTASYVRYRLRHGSTGSGDGRYAPKPPLCKGRCLGFRAPGKPSVSGFAGERRSSGATALSALKAETKDAELATTRRRDCCIVQGFCNALLDYLAAHSRKPLRKTGPWGAIPQSATLTAPFTQRGPCAVRKCVPFPLTALVSVPKGTSYGRAETSSKSLYSSEYGLF